MVELCILYLVKTPAPDSALQTYKLKKFASNFFPSVVMIDSG